MSNHAFKAAAVLQLYTDVLSGLRSYQPDPSVMSILSTSMGTIQTLSPYGLNSSYSEEYDDYIASVGAENAKLTCRQHVAHNARCLIRLMLEGTVQGAHACEPRKTFNVPELSAAALQDALYQPGNDLHDLAVTMSVTTSRRDHMVTLDGVNYVAYLQAYDTFLDYLRGTDFGADGEHATDGEHRRYVESLLRIGYGFVLILTGTSGDAVAQYLDRVAAASDRELSKVNASTLAILMCPMGHINREGEYGVDLRYLPNSDSAHPSGGSSFSISSLLYLKAVGVSAI